MPPKALAVPLGARFGRLTIISEWEHRPSPLGLKVRWVRVRCDCGKERDVRVNNLCPRPSGSNTTQCASCARFVHGDAHARPPLYTRWVKIKTRCFSPTCDSYYNYGARGITMAPEWVNDYAAFRDWILANIGDLPSPKHSLDRIDNDGNYEPGNLRWATKTEQQRNRRPSNRWSGKRTVKRRAAA
jgi:hypothetical protein